MKVIKQAMKFESKATFNAIKVSKVVKRVAGKGNREDLVRVVDLDFTGKAIKGTGRVIKSDSIRRRYWQAN